MENGFKFPRLRNLINHFIKLFTTDTEEVILASQPSDYHYQEWQQNTIKLNKFIENINQKTLTIEEKSDDLVFTGIGLAMFFAFISSIIWVAKTNITCTMSCESRKLLIERRRFFSKKTDDYSLKELKKVLLETSDGMERTVSRITFEFATGDLIPLKPYYDSYSDKKEAVRCMNKFIKEL